MGLCCSKSTLKNHENGAFSGDDCRTPSGALLLPENVRNDMEKEISNQQSHQHLTENLVLHELDRDIHQFYDINNGAILGSGMSGSVKICTDKKTRTRYALKTLSKSNVMPDKLPQLRDEIRIMASLDHPNILRVNECFETAESIYIVLDLCTGHDLLSCLNKQIHISYSEKKTCELVSMMLSALRYCHEHGIVHRDIKLENFLFENDSPTAQLKLIDFGFSQHFNPKEILHRDVGSPFYVAPEVLDKNYTEKCDVWSIGVVTYILLSGEPPFNGSNNAEILSNVKHARIAFKAAVFQHVSAEAIDFIKKALNRNVLDRMSASEAHRHPWFHMVHHPSNPPSAISDTVLASLRQFSNRSRLSRICLEVIAHVLSNKQIEALRNEFAKFDTENTGEINYAQMKQILERHSDFAEEDIRHVFDDLDIEHTGLIHYHEFIAAAITQQEITENNLKLAFDKLSHHRDCISEVDLVQLLGVDSSVQDVRNMMQEAGVTADRLYYDDFKQIMIGGKTKAALNSPYKKHGHNIRFFHNSSSNLEVAPETTRPTSAAVHSTLGKT